MRKFTSILLLVITLLGVSAFTNVSTTHAASPLQTHTVPAGIWGSQVSDHECGSTACSTLTATYRGPGYVQVTINAGGFCFYEVNLNVAYNYNSNTQNNGTGQACTNSYTHTFPTVYLGSGRHEINAVAQTITFPWIPDSSNTEVFINL